jgi:hypothetical protein
MRTKQEIETELKAERDKAIARFCEVIAVTAYQSPPSFRRSLMA